MSDSVTLTNAEKVSCVSLQANYGPTVTGWPFVKAADIHSYNDYRRHHKALGNVAHLRYSRDRRERDSTTHEGGAVPDDRTAKTLHRYPAIPQLNERARPEPAESPADPNFACAG